MSIYLRIVLVIASLLTFAYICRKLRKSQLQVSDALFWIIFSFILIVLGVVPKVAYILSEMIGIQAPVNFVFLVIIFMLMIRCFLLNVRVSFLEERFKNLVEEIAIKDK